MARIIQRFIPIDPLNHWRFVQSHLELFSATETRRRSGIGLIVDDAAREGIETVGDGSGPERMLADPPRIDHE
ncbi:hypothetical protein [Paraburkholderia hospita]|uniref:hypothetical protein n=1 Tax=Paraburkholderia hospita TaxID=169430 RepID=UPI000B344BA9|nr:hypothetical protein [Paraburkholderia hospita]OUL82254.1 hypothetical protein CA601_29555 [Paraburkholderia hospita]